jgi:hypothetical protein
MYDIVVPDIVSMTCGHDSLPPAGAIVTGTT